MEKFLGYMEDMFDTIGSVEQWQQWMYGTSTRVIGNTPGTKAGGTFTRPTIGAATGDSPIKFGKSHSYETSKDPELERVVKATLEAIPSFASASRGEYDFLKNEQKRKLEVAETKRMRERALAKQQEQINAINALPVAIAAAVDNMEGV